MHTVQLAPSPLRLIGGYLTAPPDVYASVKADLGFDPESLFPGKAENPAGKCLCTWPGHNAYGFSGMGGEGDHPAAHS